MNGDINLRFKVEDILACLKRHRDRHLDVVEEAMAGYRESLLSGIDEMVKEAERGRRCDCVCQQFKHPPFSKGKIYHEWIEKFERCLDEEVVLDAYDYKQIFLDKWDWTKEFLPYSANFSPMAAAMLND